MRRQIDTRDARHPARPITRPEQHKGTSRLENVREDLATEALRLGRLVVLEELLLARSGDKVHEAVEAVEDREEPLRKEGRKLSAREWRRSTGGDRASTYDREVGGDKGRGVPLAVDEHLPAVEEEDNRGCGARKVRED